jgi:glycerol-3-phosphate O-acyltransferase / dihydroxyacetone phosphate acyltransferase
MRWFLTTAFRRALRIFFRRIEVAGVENVPRDRPVIYAVNHPNGLVDPLFLLCFAPGRVSFLAKAPLFRMPIIGYFARAFDSIPVYRKQDNVAGTHRETFTRAREILAGGGSIAIFPEGTTHSDPQLREFKTGAARIALGAASESASAPPLIVPTGIYYTAKQTFRSEALVYFGEPIEVPIVSLDGSDEPPREIVHELTSKTEDALARLTLQADSHAALELIARTEDIFFRSDAQPLADELEIRRRFIDGYHHLRTHDPLRLASLESRIRRFEAELGRRGLEAHELTPRFDLGTILRVVFLFPIALAGAIIHYPVYRLVALLAGKIFDGANEMAATVKFVAALAFYPLIWVLAATVVGMNAGLAYGIAALIILPLLGYVALRVVEDLDDALGRTRALVHRVLAADVHARLVEERKVIRREIINLGDELPI